MPYVPIDGGSFQDPILKRQLVTMLATVNERVAARNASADRFLFRRDAAGSGIEADPRRNIGDECGWPKNPGAEMYAELYAGDSVAARVVELMPKECAKVTADVYETEDDSTTPFEDSYDEFKLSLLDHGEDNFFEAQEEGDPFADLMLRCDIASGIGNSGAAYLCLDDDLDPQQPVAGLEELGSRPSDKAGKVATPGYSANGNGQAFRGWKMKRNEEKTKGRKVLSVTPLPEISSRVMSWEGNPHSPRFGWPVTYQVRFFDNDITWSGSTPPTTTFNVHWTRMVPFADIHHQHLTSTGAVAHSRLRCVLPEVLDGRKMSGADGEAFYQNAFLKLFFETHHELGGDVLVDDDELATMMEQIRNGGQQHGRLSGMSANPIAPTVADVTPHQAAKIARICIKLGCPVPVFQGYEIGEQASENNKQDWNGRVAERQNSYLSPNVWGRTLNRLILVGALEKPGKRYYIKWPKMGEESPLIKAQTFSARMTGLSAALQGGVPNLIGEKGLLVDEMGYTEEKADKLLENAKTEQEDNLEVHGDLNDAADEHGLQKTPPTGFENKPEPPPPPGPIKMGGGESLIHPETGATLAKTPFPPQKPTKNEDDLPDLEDVLR